MVSCSSDSKVILRQFTEMMLSLSSSDLQDKWGVTTEQYHWDDVITVIIWPTRQVGCDYQAVSLRWCYHCHHLTYKTSGVWLPSSIIEMMLSLSSSDLQDKWGVTTEQYHWDDVITVIIWPTRQVGCDYRAVSLRWCYHCHHLTYKISGVWLPSSITEMMLSLSSSDLQDKWGVTTEQYHWDDVITVIIWPTRQVGCDYRAVSLRWCYHCHHLTYKTSGVWLPSSITEMMLSLSSSDLQDKWGVTTKQYHWDDVITVIIWPTRQVGCDYRAVSLRWCYHCHHLTYKTSGVWLPSSIIEMMLSLSSSDLQDKWGVTTEQYHWDDVITVIIWPTRQVGCDYRAVSLRWCYHCHHLTYKISGVWLPSSITEMMLSLSSSDLQDKWGVTTEQYHWDDVITVIIWPTRQVGCDYRAVSLRWCYHCHHLTYKTSGVWLPSSITEMMLSLSSSDLQDKWGVTTKQYHWDDVITVIIWPTRQVGCDYRAVSLRWCYHCHHLTYKTSGVWLPSSIIKMMLSLSSSDLQDKWGVTTKQYH